MLFQKGAMDTQKDVGREGTSQDTFQKVSLSLFQSFHFCVWLLWVGWRFPGFHWCQDAQASAVAQTLRKKLPGPCPYKASKWSSSQSKAPGGPGNATFDWTQDCLLGYPTGKERMDVIFSWQLKILASCSANWLQWLSPTSLGWVDDLARGASDPEIGKDTGQDTFTRCKLKVWGSHLSLEGGRLCLQRLSRDVGTQFIEPPLSSKTMM